MLVLDANAAARFDRVAFSPDGRRVAAGHWCGVYAWNLDAPDQPAFLAAEGVHCVAYLPDGRLYAGAHRDSTAAPDPVLDGHVFLSQFLAVSPASVAAVALDMTVPPNTVPLLRGYAGESGDEAEMVWGKHEHVRHHFTISPDGQRVAIPYSTLADGGVANGIRFLNLKDGTEVEDVRLSESLPHLVISPDGRWFVSPFLNHIRCWHRGQTDGKVRRIENDSREHICGLAFHPSGRRLAATSNDATVKVYDTATWRLDRTFTWAIGRMRGIAFSPDGTLAAAGGDAGQVVVWDVDL